MVTKRVLVLAMSIGLIMEAAPVASQTIEEIIITARKREESILKVPVVATVITGKTLEEYQTASLWDVANRVPGFVMGESVGTVGIQASLRGIGPTSQTPTVDQSVSLNIDGLSLSQGYAFTAGMFDIGQVEVLKGPQALFFGKNSTAGVISLRSLDPTDEFEFIVRGGYEFKAEEKLGEVIVSGPVADSLKLRLATQYTDSDGFFENNGVPIPGLGNLPPKYSDFAPRKNLIVRGTALFEPNEIYKGRLKANYVHDKMYGSGGDGQLVLCPDGTGGVPPVNIPFIGDSDCNQDRHTQLADFDPAYWPGVRNNGVPFMDSNQNFGTLEQNIVLSPEYVLTAVTGLYDLKQDNLIRGSGSSNPPIAADYTFKNQQFTQELRLTTDFADSPVNFMVGAFYQDATIKIYNRLRANIAFGLPPLLQLARNEIDIDSVSLFGQAIWQLSDQVEIAAGARWTDEKRKHKEYNGFTDWSKVDLLVPQISSDNVSPEITVTYTPTDDLTLFASYRQGFKSGSFNTIVFVKPTERVDFGDEKAQGGDAGLKARFLDGSMTVNLAGYYYRYKDLQVGANDLTPTGGIVLRTINAASANVEGVELDLTYSPVQIQHLTLRGALNYNRSRYDDFDNAPCGNGQTIGQGCNQLFDPSKGVYTAQDLSDQPLVRAPDWSANFGFDYEMPVWQDLTLAFGATTTYSDEYFTNLVALPDYKQDSYFKTSANIALRGKDDQWEIAVIGNNLGNEITAGLCSNSNTQNGTIFGGQVSGAEFQGPAGSDELGCVAERGRELWVRLSFRL